MGFPLIAVNQPGVLSRQLFRGPFLAPPPCYGGEQCNPKKVCSVRLPNSQYCFALKESDHIEPSRLCAGPQLQLPVFLHLLLRRSPIATGLLYDLHICACCECVLLIKMTCAVNWIIVRERRAESTSLSHPDLPGSRGKTVSGHLELSPDAVDDHDFFCALSCSPCSTACCCIAIWAVKS